MLDKPWSAAHLRCQK